jgi:photosystem II stability/assembly factor-like uncharacterized protein
VPRTIVARAPEGNLVDASIGPAIRGLRPGRGRWRCTTLALVLAIAVSGGLRGQSERSSAPGSRPLAEERRADELADLVAAVLALSQPFPLPAETVTITARVDNRAGEAARGVVLRVLADGKTVAEKRVDVAARASYQLRASWQAPRVAGMVTLALVVDPEGALSESDRSDNRRELEVAVAPKPPPGTELAVVSVERVAVPEQPGAIRVVVKNGGKKAVEVPVVVRVDGRAVATRLAGPLAPGKEAVIEVPWPPSQPITELAAEIGPRFRNAERYPRDNELRRTLLPGANLRIEDLSVDAPLVRGTREKEGRPRRVRVTWRLTNRGVEAVRSPVRVRLTPAFRDAKGWHSIDFTAPPLAAGESIAFSYLIENAEHEFEIVLEADVDNSADESDENDNRVLAHYSNPPPDVDRWVSMGPEQMTDIEDLGYGWDDASGRLSTLVIDPADPATMYAGAQSSGVWKTVDGGQSWQPVSDAATLSVAGLAIDPSLPSRLYLATRSAGVYQSIDSGTSWTQISTADLQAVVHAGAFVIHPANPTRLFVASDQGVQRSTDSGATWALSLAGGEATALVADPARPGRLYAAIFHETDETVAGIFRTDDFGDNWVQLTGCPGGGLPLGAGFTMRFALDGERLYASFRGASDFRVFRTNEFGCSIGGRLESSWELGFHPGGDTFKILWSGMWANPADPGFVYLGGTDFWRSTDSGNSFSDVAAIGGPQPGAHSDHHFFAADPVSANVIYTLNDGSIYRSADRGAAGTFQWVGHGLRNGEYYDHALAATDPDLVIGGTQDNGTLKHGPGSDVWRMVLGGDGATVAVDPTDSDVLYAMNQYASSIARSTNGGGGFSNIAGGLPEGTVCFNLHFQVHPGDPATLLASCSFSDEDGNRFGGLWRASPPGSTWSVIFMPPTGSIKRSDVDPSVDLYWAGASDGIVYAGPSGSAFRAVFANPGASLTDLDVDPGTPAVVYAAFSGSAARRVYRLWRGDPAAIVLLARDITSDLPTGLAVKTLAVDRMQPDTVFVGTNAGAYRGRSLDGGVTWFWTPYNNGLPLPDVRDLEAHPTTGVLRAATFGRGVYEVNTDFPLGSLLAIEGVPIFLRAHDVGTGFGPPGDQIDGEAVVRLDVAPHRAFGFQLRNDGGEGAHHGMLDLLRDAFNRRHVVRIEYIRTGFRNGRIVRVIEPQ